jgi:hypothetical protein
MASQKAVMDIRSIANSLALLAAKRLLVTNEITAMKDQKVPGGGG